MYAPGEMKVDPKDGNIANGYSEMLFVQPAEKDMLTLLEP
jgi:hypothetical protein